jgi:DNA mismatch repair protein MutH
MAILDLKKIKTAEELEKIAKKDLEGKTMRQIMGSITDLDDKSRVLTKAGVGYVIEEGYFGIGKNSIAGPDIEHLDVEVKTSPLKFLKNGKLTVKEPLSLNIINYKETSEIEDIKESSLYKKNKKILFVWYIHDNNIPRSEYLVKYVFLWEMDRGVLEELKDDYQKILVSIKLGQAHEMHQHQHDSLTLCPKHNGDFDDPDCTKSKTPQPFSEIMAEVRAFRLKNSYMNKVIRRYLKKEHPSQLDEFNNTKAE